MGLWTQSPEAASLLASCAAFPPRRRLFVYRFQETQLRFVGRRVRRLCRLYRDAQPAIDTPEWRCWLVLDPQRAIEHAVADRRVETAGTGLRLDKRRRGAPAGSRTVPLFGRERAERLRCRQDHLDGEAMPTP